MAKQKLVETQQDQEAKVKAKEEQEKKAREDQERMDRIQCHLDWIGMDLKELLKKGTTMVGPLRQAGAQCKAQFPGDGDRWPILALIQQVLNEARKKAGLPPARPATPMPS